ncbi:integrase_H2C2 domain-containing protein [Nephila pilipes]|uniref:Integrase_H2C2 domain-containing protein n=1 Tax=Nephila pilipes TaxID=299642 RepID=A0A8X6PPT9_NEPPI|nr:integrase_H2C2 domain-containing protein [Nephila pilipes]
MVNIQTADIMSDYFSTYSRNVRVVAWILRFIHNISNVNKLRGNLVYEEFKKAENLVFKSMQLRSFQDEKFLAKMQAFKDEEGLLRIRTKLVDSDEKEDFKFPVLLPANDVVVKLIREEHKKAMHAGSYILLARLRENFWIIKAKKTVGNGNCLRNDLYRRRGKSLSDVFRVNRVSSPLRSLVLCLLSPFLYPSATAAIHDYHR